MGLQFLQYPSDPPSPIAGTIVFLHGLGAGADDFADLPHLFSLSPQVRYVFPQAPPLPITVNGGMLMPAWYDIQDMTFERKSDTTTVANSLSLLSELLDTITKDTPPSKIIIGGFSQGGAMALEVGMNYSHHLAGVISLSAYSLHPKRIEDGDHVDRKGIPLFLGHGQGDQVVPFQLGARHRTLFQQANFDLTWYEEAELGHHLSQNEVEAMKKWLRRFPFLWLDA